MEAEGRVAKQVGSRCYFAVVRVRFNSGPPGPVAVDPNTISDYHRGSGWDEAAVVGAGLGLALSGTGGTCTVTQVRGMDCDTSPAGVAIAAARAVWAVVGFTPSAELAARVEACVLRGHKLSPDELVAELLVGESGVRIGVTGRGP